MRHILVMIISAPMLWAPAGIKLTSQPQYTPTFLLIEKGWEIGRIEDYPGEDFYWGLLGRLLGKLPPARSAQADAAARS